jgi:hypothetical protein
MLAVSGDHSIHIEKNGLIGPTRGGVWFVWFVSLPGLLEVGTITSFDSRDFLQAPPVAFLTGERGCEVSRYQITCQRGTNHSPTQYQDIYIVVFHSLAIARPVGRIGIVTKTGPNARQLVGGHRSADAAAADQRAPVWLAVQDSLADGLGIVRIGHRLCGMYTDIHVLMAQLAHMSRKIFF